MSTSTAKDRRSETYTAQPEGKNPRKWRQLPMGGSHSRLGQSWQHNPGEQERRTGGTRQSSCEMK
jgi:hypothetical protein